MRTLPQLKFRRPLIRGAGILDTPMPKTPRWHPSASTVFSQDNSKIHAILLTDHVQPKMSVY